MILARIEAKKETKKLVQDEVLKLIEPTRKEKGCIQYELFQDNEQSELFFFIETWESNKLWKLHMESKHLKNFIEQTEGALVDLNINQITKLK